MAQSPAHKFGQLIGDILEAALVPQLEAFARQHALYLDRNGPRACRPGRKVTWLDRNGNAHDLDFVLERGGSSNDGAAGGVHRDSLATVHQALAE
jgi:hypothetical protein